MTSQSNRSREITELEENLWATWSLFGRGPGCSLHDEEDLLGFDTPIPTIPYNGVLRCRAPADVDRVIQGLVEHFRQRKAQFMWILHPSSALPDLARRLVDHGLTDVEPLPGMTRTLDNLPELPPPPDGIEIRKVANERDASALYQFAAWRWHVPPEHQTIYESIASGFGYGSPGAKVHMGQAWRGDDPVAKAGMALTDTSAGIYAVVTRPEARCLGLARMLTLTALHDAKRRGLPMAVLHSSPMAESLYRGLGFQTMAEFRLFASEDFHL